MPSQFIRRFALLRLDWGVTLQFSKYSVVPGNRDATCCCSTCLRTFGKIPFAVIVLS